MTADFGNFVTKNDKKWKTKDEMNPANSISTNMNKPTNKLIYEIENNLWVLKTFT